MRIPRALVVGGCLTFALSSAVTAWAWVATSYFRRLERGSVLDGLPNTAHYQFWGLHLQAAIHNASIPLIALATVAVLAVRRNYLWALVVLPLAFIAWWGGNVVFFLVSESAYP